MISISQALLLGLVQGVTEFLPISSSGHLAVVQRLLQVSEPPLLFDVIVHVGSLFSVVVYFRNTIQRLSWRYLLYIVIGTLPIIFAALLLGEHIKSLFANLLVVAGGFWVSAGLLYVSNRALVRQRREEKPLSVRSSFAIGVIQAIAIIPGVSRSGSTVSAGLLTGLPHDEAFSYSFLLSIPAILGALVLQVFAEGNGGVLLTTANLVGFLTAFVVGFASLKILHRIVTAAKLHYFCLYLVLIGALTFFLGIQPG